MRLRSNTDRTITDIGKHIKSESVDRVQLEAAQKAHGHLLAATRNSTFSRVNPLAPIAVERERGLGLSNFVSGKVSDFAST